MRARQLTWGRLISLAILALALAGAPVLGQGGGNGPGGQQPGGAESGPLSGWQGLPVERNLLLPQVAVGGDIATTLVPADLGSRLRQGWLASDQPITTGRIARYVDQIFDPSDLPEEFKGILEVTTDSVGIVTLDLLQTGRVLTSLPLYHFGRRHKD